MGKVIYIAEDDNNILRLIKSFLEDAGYEAIGFPTGDLLYAEYEKKQCDLVILDIMMPGTDGLTICSKLREISNVPIIILTAKDSEMDYVQGINMGSDDYLVKPFSPTVLMMRVKALLRRVEMERNISDELEKEKIEYEDLVYYNEEKAVFCKGKNLNLTMTELHLLVYLLKNAAKAVSKDELLSEIWGFDTDVETRVTDETIRKIRKKMLASGSAVRIQTIWGFGYKLGITKKV